MRGPARWASRWAVVRAGLLNRDGVERAAVGAVAALKIQNIVQLLVSVVLTWGQSRRPWLELLTAGFYLVSGAALLITAVRGQRLRRAAVGVDVVVACGVLLVAPLFAPAGAAQVWFDWPIVVSLLVAAEASACFPAPVAAAATGALMVATGSWLATGAPGADSRHMVYGSFVPLLAFSAVAYAFFNYLRRLADLADARARTIRMLEEERTRRVLHTPYRLLHDLATLLREQSDRDSDPARHAQLAEAVASAREIESIVRGTEPASSNLASELRQLREQFIDLPLIMNVEDAGMSLPPDAVYRVREAVRSALQNVRLHAHASEVVVYATTDQSGWLVSVYDDGRGFDPTGPRSVGLEQVIVGALTEIGARVTIGSAPGHGTLIEISKKHG